MSVLQGLRDALPALRTSVDEADRLAYGRDLWPRHHFGVRAGRPAGHKPCAIAWPESTDQLALLVRWAAREGIPLVPFGAGSGVCGGILPRADALVVDLKQMARIRAIDREAPLVAVEAGHLGLPLEQTLNRAGFTLGHFPSSILCSTVGGWLATRSAGQCSGAYGKIEDMVVALECVTGSGEIVELRRRAMGPDLVPLVVGSEGTLAVIASAELRLHPAPTSRSFGAWSFPTTEHGWDAMRALFQAGLRPAIARLYDPFDAMMAKRGAVRPADEGAREPTPGHGGAALRALLKRPERVNDLLQSNVAARALGGAMLLVIFDETASPNGPTNTDGAGHDGRMEEARRIIEAERGRWEGDAPARRWLMHRYSVSYRQAPVFANGAFVDTLEVAAEWSKLGRLYEAVRRALGAHVFVMAHFSHAYPDGCCIYFSFAGSATAKDARRRGWEEACEATYDRAWRAALKAAVDAGGTLAHHHGVGRSKAPRLPDELGIGIDVVRRLMHGFDPCGILNPGNLLPDAAPATTSAHTPSGDRLPIEIDRTSLLVCVDGASDLASVERHLNEAKLTLDVRFEGSCSVGEWLGRGAPGTRDRWLDPVDQLLAGLDATLTDGRVLCIRPAPRRAVGPDLTALFVGAGGRFGRIDRAWLRVHPISTRRPTSATFQRERQPPLTAGERTLLEAIARTLAD